MAQRNRRRNRDLERRQAAGDAVGRQDRSARGAERMARGLSSENRRKFAEGFRNALGMKKKKRR